MLIQHRFHPVGQGLFAAGRLSFEQSGNLVQKRDFQWVYDCGTTSSQRLVRKSLNRFRDRKHNRKLDLVVISHFDFDHISGIVKLLNDVGTQTLMLPWAPLWHRLVIGFSQGLEADDPEFGFYADPMQYFVDQAGDGFERIVFIPPSNGEGPASPDGGGEPDFGPEGDLPLKVEADMETEMSREVADDFNEWQALSSNSSTRHQVLRMQQGGAAFIPSLWEFVPYNDPSTTPRRKKVFMERVEVLRDALIGSTDDRREAALDELKVHYIQLFPKSQQNDLSLFLYGGPIGEWHSVHHMWARHRRGAVIYTGDGNLSSNEKWKTFSSYLGNKRSFRPTVFQVPHHGSEKNWFDGLASIIDPGFSIISSDPEHRRLGHPDASVLRDLWSFNPVQVDKVYGLFFEDLLFRT